MRLMKSSRGKSHPGLPPLSIRLGIALFILWFTGTGCALLKVKKGVRQSIESTVLVGLVATANHVKGPIIVAAYTIDKGERSIAHYTVLHEAGEYELLVAKGNYYIIAYHDKNSNLVYDDGEPAGQYGPPAWVSAPAGGVVGDLNLEIPEKGRHIDLPLGFAISKEKPQKLYSRQAGAILDFNDELFSEQNGQKGYWEGMKFFKTIGGNIYFVEPYDPDKIPILFIHGATGTPKGWKYFAENIDRTRFQPWLFYYPSGARIKTMSHLLLWKLSNLSYKYRFKKIYFTAHSLGGLVARSFIMDYGKAFPNIELFVSLATPWGGDRMAELGVKQSPAVIPCWIDMQPESNFMKNLYAHKMPEHVKFYMFYGHRGSRNPFRSNNDGTIAFSSLLDFRAQSEAKMSYAFEEDHASIIYSDKVLRQYKAILNAVDTREGDATHHSGGNLKVLLSNYTLEGPGNQVSIVLCADDECKDDTVVDFYHDHGGNILGPFPAGDYIASIFTPTAKPEKTWLPVTIENNKTHNLHFNLIPDGRIFGMVATALKPEDRPAGMPHAEYLPPDRKIMLQSITISGNGTHRKIRPFKGSPKDRGTNFLHGTDFFDGDTFFIFGLPAGAYDLNIKAQGYKPYTVSHLVVPGQRKNLIITDLSPGK